MAAADLLLETAAQRYAFDVTAGAGRRMYTARSIAAASDGSRLTAALLVLSNGVSYDPCTNTRTGTLLASAARTVLTSTPAQTNYNARGIILHLSITAVPAVPGAGGLVPRLVFADPVSGSPGSLYVNAAATARQAVGVWQYVFFPGLLTGIALDQAVPTPIPRTWSVDVTVGDAQSYTYSLGYSEVV